ncbi:unnamed protein product, partial [marine sediment metagenome]
YISCFKKLRTFNGIGRGLFKTGTSRRITNLQEDHEGYYWTLYINTLCEYDSCANYGLNEIKDTAEVFFYDRLN